MAILIYPDATTPKEVFPADPDAGFVLSELYALLDCSNVELISLPNDLDMWIDGEGKMSDNHRPNAYGTALLEAAGGFPGDYIAGRILICNPCDVK